jgi:hypothetical protein
VQNFLEALSDVFADNGMHVSPQTIGAVLAIVAAIIAVRIGISLVRGVISALGSVASFTRDQVRNKFWRDSGKLATLISLILLMLAYGFYDRDQPLPLGQALARLGRDRLLEVLPIAILTQVVLLCGFWLIYGLIFRVPRKTLIDPFKSLVLIAATMAVLCAGSVGLLLFIGDDPQAHMVAFGLSMLGAFLVVLLYMVPMAKSAQRATSAPSPGKPRRAAIHLFVAVIAILLLCGMIGSLGAAAYTAISDHPTVLGMIGFVAVIVAVVMLIACYRFRAYIGQAEVPAATGHFIDFSLAISALGVALFSQPSAAVTLAGLPPWLIAIVPALLVATAVLVFNLLRLRTSTPRWALCLTVAIIAGLLAGPAKAVLTPALTPLAHLIPVPNVVAGLEDD